MPPVVTALLIILSVLIFIFILIIICNIKIVKQTEKVIVERLGAYRTTWGVGMHMLMPFFDRIAVRVSMKEQVRDFEPQSVITKDNVTMQIDTVVFYVVTDAKLYAYGVENPMAAINYLSATTLRNIIGELLLDECLTSRELINEKMRKILDEATDPWGIKVNRVEVKNILPPKDIRVSLILSSSKSKSLISFNLLINSNCSLEAFILLSTLACSQLLSLLVIFL